MTRDVARRPNALSVHALEEIEIDGQEQDHAHALDHGIVVPELDEVSDHHMLAKNWSIIDGNYAVTYCGGILHLKKKNTHTRHSVDAQVLLNVF